MDRSGDAIPEALGAVRPGPGDVVGVAEMTGQMASVAKIPAPTVWILPSEEPNAFATGFTPYDSAVTLTTGLLENLDGRELRAVVAHEIGHIVNGDVAEGTAMVERAALNLDITIGLTVGAELATLITSTLLDDWLVFGAGAIVNAAARKRANSRVIRFSREREFAADQVAVQMGFGPWLASGLRRVEQVPVSETHRLPQWTRILLAYDSSQNSTHPSTPSRLRAIPVVDPNYFSGRSCSTCRAPLGAEAGACPECGSEQHVVECRCGTAASVDDRYCCECGELLVHTTCRVCGHAVSENDPFCTNCGLPLP